jgi:hypothetical protein
MSEATCPDELDCKGDNLLDGTSSENEARAGECCQHLIGASGSRETEMWRVANTMPDLVDYTWDHIDDAQESVRCRSVRFRQTSSFKRH